MDRPKLPYNYDYKLYLEIGLANGSQEGEINPSTESIYSEDEWNALSRDEQEAWLNSETKEWANNYIDMGWLEPKI